jgi:hypothetical protein
MSFDPEYENRKDHRKPYYDSRDFDRSCRSNGGCPWCKENRLHANKLRAQEAEDEIEEYLSEN